MPHKGIVCEQGFKDRLGDEVLGQHFHHLAGADGGIDVLAQPGQEVVKGGLVRAGNGDQAVDAFHIALSDPGNVRRPLFPVAFIADLLHHAGINGPLQFLKMRQGQRELGRRAASLACRGHSAFLLRRVSVGNAADEHRAAVLRLVAVQLQLVDHGAETVIMRPQGIEDCPDHGKTLVVVEGFFRRHSGRDEDGNDDVAEFLARRRAHDAPHGLHHVDLGIAGRKEQHRVQRGHVHAFGKAAHIGEDAALVAVGRGGIEPGQLFVAGGGGHGAVHMLRGHADHFRAFLLRQAVIVAFLEAVEDRADPFGYLDVLTEGDRLAHGRGIGCPEQALVNEHPLGQGVDAADELAGVVGIDLLAAVRHGGLQGGGDLAFTERQHQHLVVRQQIFIDRLAKADTKDLRPVQGFIIHRTEPGFGILRLFLAFFRIEARGGRHVEALFRLNKGIVMHLHKGGIFRVLQGDAGGAVGLVADNQIKGPLNGLLRFRNDGYGLVGGKDDQQTVRMKFFRQPELTHDVVHIGGRGKGQIGNAVAVLIFVLFASAFADFGIGADADGEDVCRRFRRPFPQGLTHQRNGRSQKQHKPPAAGLVLRNLQGGEGLARAAGHDQLAAIPGLEMLVKGGYGRLLMRARLLAFLPGLRAADALFQRGPVHGRVFQIGKADALYRRFLMADGVFRLAAPFVGGGYPEPERKGGRLLLVVDELLAGRGQKAVHGGLVYGGCFCIALALDGPEISLHGLRHQIDARILAAEVLLVREFLPEPDMPERARIPRHRLQKSLHEPLETVALVAFGKGNGAVPGKDILKGHGAFSLKKDGMSA